jgi:iron complex transport system ATP-binding protein
MAERSQLLHTSGLIIGYHQGNKRKQVAGPLNLEVAAGQLICLLGPNGCGKSTLLRTIAGLQGALQGHIEIEGKDLHQLKPAQIAKKISLVLTDNVRAGNLDVYALIALGRYPHSGWLGVLNKKDREIIDQAVASTHTAAFLERKLDSLSDGECQKVMLARALAQDTPLIILDEPTAHLDLPSRIQLMRLLHQLAKDTNKAILISTHELDLALQVADQIWLMRATGELSVGLPEELVLNGSFQEAFDKDGILFDPLTGTFNIHQRGHKPVTVNGQGATAFWTKRALVRNGYHINSTGVPAKIVVTAAQQGGRIAWTLNDQGTITLHTGIPALLQALEAAYKF